tara:strand:- start:479 stop:736 length:258 start_codon:yes stop_codon:yes gene_type:complete
MITADQLAAAVAAVGSSDDLASFITEAVNAKVEHAVWDAIYFENHARISADNAARAAAMATIKDTLPESKRQKDARLAAVEAENG